jgi:2-(1,2-epoxy-1,2-dihydrophenyl)acetyl-CoA isomerase
MTTPDTEQAVLSEQRDGVLLITLNRPARLNALTDEMRGALRDLLHGARADSTVRAIVLTGAGRAFCSGAELGGDRAAGSGDGRGGRPIPRVPRFAWLHDFREVPVPVVAAVNGVAAGAGMGLALACDVRVMARDTYLYPAFVHRGLGADNGVAWTLARLAGTSRALRWLWSGARIAADEALATGLADVVVDAGTALDEALRLADTWARGPSLAIAAMKQQVYQAEELSFSRHLLVEEHHQARLSQTEDAREGVAALAARAQVPGAVTPLTPNPRPLRVNAASGRGEPRRALHNAWLPLPSQGRGSGG